MFLDKKRKQNKKSRGKNSSPALRAGEVRPSQVLLREILPVDGGLSKLLRAAFAELCVSVSVSVFGFRGWGKRRRREVEFGGARAEKKKKLAGRFLPKLYSDTHLRRPQPRAS